MRVLDRHRRAVSELTRLVAIAASLLMLTVLVVNRSQAAFSDTTTNSGNSFGSGTVVITDDAASALFTASGMAPGARVSNCLEVTYAGSLTPADVKVYGASSGALAPYLTMSLEKGSGGQAGDCTGFVADGAAIYSGTLSSFTTAHTAWADGLAAFTANANPTVTVFRFTFAVQDDNNAQGLSADATITFEAQH